MLNTTVAGLCAGLIALLAAPLAASAQDAIAAPGQKTIGQPQATKDAMIPSLAVINSRGATLQGARSDPDRCVGRIPSSSPIVRSARPGTC